MKCIVVDDEPLARQGMQILLQNIPEVNITGMFGNAIEAGLFLKRESVDLVFLDINMPELSGMEFVKTLISRPLIIFVTAYPQYALDGFELDAVDYLVKPLRLERLMKAVNKAESYHKMLSAPAENASIDSIGKDYFFVKADRKFTKVPFNSILYIEGLKDYVVIKMADRKIITAMNVKTIAGQLPEKIFVRINKSFIVNIQNITSVDSYYVYINNEEIPIGESFKNDFMNTFIIGNTISRK